MPAGDGGLRGLLVVLSDNHHCVLDQGRPGGRKGGRLPGFPVAQRMFSAGAFATQPGKQSKEGPICRRQTPNTGSG